MTSDELPRCSGKYVSEKKGMITATWPLDSYDMPRVGRESSVGLAPRWSADHQRNGLERGAAGWVQLKP